LYAYYQNPNGITHSGIWRKLCLDKLDALVEQIEFFKKRKIMIAEMQRLMICIHKIKDNKWNSEQFTQEDKQKIQRIEERLVKQYPYLLSFYNAMKRNQHKSIYPVLFFLYKKFVDCVKFCRWRSQC
jgi:hypothetical protein